MLDITMGISTVTDRAYRRPLRNRPFDVGVDSVIRVKVGTNDLESSELNPALRSQLGRHKWFSAIMPSYDLLFIGKIKPSHG